MTIMHNTKEDIYKLVDEQDVEFIRLQFTDIFGTTKNMAVTTSQLEKVLNNDAVFDGSVIDGFIGYEKSELRLFPDLDTFTIFPWRPQSGKVARMICDVCNYDGTPYSASSRNILKKVIEKAKDMGFIFDIGPECEFYLFERDENDEPTTNTREKGNYFDIGPTDEGENARREMVMMLEDMGFEIESSYHEASPSQHEIDFRKDETLRTADNLMTFRMAVRTIAKRHGLHATFMPKPRLDLSGSAMNISIAAYNEDGKNIFHDKDDDNHLSQDAYHFIGGILSHVDGLAAICNPTVNSYKRLRDMKHVPVLKGWSTVNNNAAIRVPINVKKGTVTLKFPDSSANPYLALAVIIAAGLDGIKNKITPDEMIEKGIRLDTESYTKLPLRLCDSLDALVKDSLLTDTLGKELSDVYINAKRKEYNDYICQVTPWELEQYLYRI